MLKSKLPNPNELEQAHKANSAKVKQAKTKKAPLTLEEAWKKIGNMANSEPDKVKLREVYIAMREGKIMRESDDKTFTKAEALRLWVELNAITRQERLDELVAKTPDNYILVTELQQLHALTNEFEKLEIIAVDTETTGVNVWRDELVGISLTNPVADSHYYIPINHNEFGFINTDNWDMAHEFIDWILSRPTAKVFHNAIFDLHILRNAGFTVNGDIHDTLIAFHLLNENEPSFRLKDLATKYLKQPSDTFDTLFGKDCKFNEVELKYARYYAIHDTKLTYDLFEYCKKYLIATDIWNYYETVEQPLIRVVERMEQEGFKVDVEELHTQIVDTRTRIKELESELKQELSEINFNSTQQLQQALGNLGIMVTSTSKDELKKWSDKAIIEKILEYKGLIKHLTGFLEKVPSMIQDDGKIHPSYNANGTVTGRFSSRNPNAQQLPKEARKIYKVDDNSLICGIDYSAQEIRMLTHFTQEPFLIEVYENGRDFYSEVASKVFKKPVEECLGQSPYRKKAKVLTLAILYGMSAKALGVSLGTDKKEAQKIMDEFYDNFTRIKEWMESNLEFCKRNLFVKMPYGRKRRLPKINSRDYSEKSRSARQASANAIIQGASAIQTKLSLIELDRYCQSKKLQGRSFALLATVHDENLIRVPVDVTELEIKELEDIMINAFPLSIPVAVDTEWAKRWGDFPSFWE